MGNKKTQEAPKAGQCLCVLYLRRLRKYNHKNVATGNKNKEKTNNWWVLKTKASSFVIKWRCNREKTNIEDTDSSLGTLQEILKLV